MEKADYTNRLNFMAIVDACKEFLPEIRARYRLESGGSLRDINFKGVLENHRVRFLNQEGKFDYAYFGEFFFRSMGVMMLVTKESEYTHYHTPDCLSDTLWSTVPVFYAGIETGVRDDTGKMIHTGDILTCWRKSNPDFPYCGMVRYLPFSHTPSIQLDMHDLFLNDCEKFHIEGSVFTEFNTDQLDVYDIGDYEKYAGAFMYGDYRSFSEEDWNKLRKTPEFTDGGPKRPAKNVMIYREEDIYSALRPDDEIICFCSASPYEDENGESVAEVYSDYNGDISGHHCQSISIDLYNPDPDALKKDIAKLLLIVHNHPETRYVVLDMKKAIGNKKLYGEIHDYFAPVREYMIRNIVLPTGLAL